MWRNTVPTISPLTPGGFPRPRHRYHMPRSIWYARPGMSIRMIWLTFLAVTAVGCANIHASRPATAADPATAQPAWWLEQPAVVSVQSTRFDALYGSTEQSLRDRGFVLDRQDRRDGVLTSKPTITRQPLEFWRGDAVSSQALAESALATVRRTVHIRIARRDDGRFELTPRVVVERFVQRERRMTAAVNYTGSLGTGAVEGSAEEDRGETAYNAYWYATGRDHDLEQALAADIRKNLSRF